MVVIVFISALRQIFATYVLRATRCCCVVLACMLTCISSSKTKKEKEEDRVDIRTHMYRTILVVAN